MKKPSELHISPGILLLFLSGAVLLISLPALSHDNLALWRSAKALYAAGAILFLFER